MGPSRRLAVSTGCGVASRSAISAVSKIFFVDVDFAASAALPIASFPSNDADSLMPIELTRMGIPQHARANAGERARVNVYRSVEKSSVSNRTSRNSDSI